METKDKERDDEEDERATIKSTFAERGFDSKFEGKVMPTLISKYARIVALFRAHLWATGRGEETISEFSHVYLFFR